MFSQFRQAVENLAQPLQDNPDGRSQSPEPPRQSSVEPRAANLRKSVAAQRIAGPATPRARSASPGPAGPRKTTLEERLRASLAGSEASPASASKPSRTVSSPPQTVPVTQGTTTPVPDSPKPAPPSPPSTSARNSIQAEEPVHIAEPGLALRDSNDPVQSPERTPLPDTQPGPTSLTLDSTNAVQTDTTTGPCVDATSTEEVQQAANTEDHQPLVQQCRTEVCEVVDEPTIVVVEPSGEEGTKTEPGPMVVGKSNNTSVEALQERLKLVEQRFAEVSTSFKKLQVERRDMDGVISELTPLEGSTDVAAFREYLVSVNMKVELGQDDLQRLNGKLTRQEERLEELQDTHQRESALQSDQLEKLRQQLGEAEALINASQPTVSQTEEDKDRRDSEIEQLRTEVSKANEMAKEEEEKRVKAISLLKTVRQKLVKAEKERDDVSRELNEARDRSQEERERDRAERANLEKQVDVASAEREKVVAGLQAQFDKDIATVKDRAERDIQAARQQFDAEINVQKNSYSTEISAKKSRIGTLEHTVANLASENRVFFEQLELRQAELESSQCHSESLQAQNTELQFQLKELQERIALLTDEVGEIRGEHEIRTQVSGVSAEELSQLVSSVEVKYEAKLTELRKTLSTAEKERTEAEATWSRKLIEKTKETEELKRKLQSSVQLRERDEDVTGALKAEIEKLQTEARAQQDRLYELQTHIGASKDTESSLHRRLAEVTTHVDEAEKQLEESKSREVQLHTQNKVLRDELRKVQNSVAILERQRSSGVSYWTSRPGTSNSRTSISSISDAPSSSSLPPAKNDEEINYEYLRNVILQFLEHKEMRPNLVRVLSTILRFTPQETRQLMSKI